jgi:two-component system cell cycle response regulator
MANTPPIECPKCGHKNDPGAATCANCHITLRWALKYWGRGVPGTKATHPPLILHADDDDGCITLVSMVLEIMGGCRVVNANDGSETLELAADLLPDLLLMDVKMPGMGGLEVLERLKADPALRTIPVVMLTATRGRNVVQQALDLGAKDYWHLPLTPAELVERVSTVLGVDASLPHAMLVQSASPNPFAEMTQFLRSVGYWVSAIQEGESALHSARQPARSRPIVILSAFNLADMSGLELLARLKADPDAASIPVVMLAEEPEPELHRRAVELGAHGTYTGPFDAEKLLEVLRTALDDKGDP